MRFNLFRMLLINWSAATMIACSSTGHYQQAMEMSVDDYKSKITIDESSSDQFVVISSKNALEINLGTSDSDKDDNYVRAFVNKSNGESVYQVVNLVHYENDGWKFFNQVKYLTQEGLQEENTTMISREVTGCSVFFGCDYIEKVGFEIPEKLVKKGASRYKLENKSGLKYKLIPNTGEDYLGIVFAQELIAVLLAVEDYKKIKISKAGNISY